MLCDIWGGCWYLGFEGLEKFVLVTDTAAQSGQLALCCLLGALLCQEGCVCHQVRALSTLRKSPEAGLYNHPQHWYWKLRFLDISGSGLVTTTDRSQEAGWMVLHCEVSTVFVGSE